jgi:AcrR family transcriptional regulator
MSGKPSVRERLAQAAFELFDERGYEQATIEDIAERAGLSRATFFRHYRSKEEVIFPDHDSLLSQIGDRLRTSSHDTALVAVSDAVRLVLLHYIEEGDVARRRYALTSTVPALRGREIISVARYQRLFREFIAGWMASHGQTAPLRAELMASSVVSAHNHVLRRWLRGESLDPVREVDEAMRQVIALFAPPGANPGTPDPRAADTTVLAFRTAQPLEDLLPALQQVLDGQPPYVASPDTRPGTHKRDR